MLKPWLIVAPEVGRIDPVVDGQGPMEYWRDVVHVEAETRRDALIMGVMLFRQQDATYLRDYDSPYAGVEVHLMLCKAHGMPTWERDHYECKLCEPI